MILFQVKLVYIYIPKIDILHCLFQGGKIRSSFDIPNPSYFFVFFLSLVRYYYFIMSGLIALDITQQIDLASLKKDFLSGREQMIIKSYENLPWTGETNNKNNKPIMMILDRDILFQILMVENISRSKQSQLDDINIKLDPKNQRVDRLNASKLKNPNQPQLRQNVITQIDMDNDNNTSSHLNSISHDNDMFKFTIQGKNGMVFFAITTFPMKWGNCALGAKIIIKQGTIFNKKIFILKKSTNATFLGGINRIWNENRDLKVHDYLTQKLQRDRSTATTTQGSRKRKATT